MKYTLAQKKLFEKKRKIATVKYILPFAAVILTLVLLLLPCFYFTDYEKKDTENTSVIERMTSIWESSRKTVFTPNPDTTSQYIAFCQITMYTIALLALAFLVAFAASLLYMIAGLKKIYSENENSKLTAITRTFIPNEFVLCLLTFPAVLPTLMPRIIVAFIERLLVVYSKVTFLFGDIMIWGLALWLIPLVYMISTLKYKDGALDIFAKSNNKKEIEAQDDETDKYDQNTSYESEIYRMSAESRNEQAQKLRRLLGIDDEDK